MLLTPNLKLIFDCQVSHVNGFRVKDCVDCNAAIRYNRVNEKGEKEMCDYCKNLKKEYNINTKKVRKIK
jgi:hypothetical protein